MPDTPPQQQRSRRHWLLEPQMMVGLAAILISVCALGVSFYEASLMREQHHLMREQQRASVWPALSIGASYNREGLTLLAENAGVGPAIVETVAVTVDGRTQQSWSDVLAVLTQGRPYAYTTSAIVGRVLPSDRSLDMLVLPSGAVADTVWTQLERLRMEICYCSVYNECWRTTLRSTTSEPVAQCPPPTSGTFETTP